MIKDPKKIVISRTDSIGDVCLTLPMAGYLKELFPEVEIIFLGNTYTKPVISCCEHVDVIWEWATISTWSYNEQIEWLRDQQVDVFIHVFPNMEIARLAKKANIKHRIGTSHRVFHLATCNHRPNFTRKRSDLHESQLNFKLLKPFGLKEEFSLEKIFGYAGFTKIPDLPEWMNDLLLENGNNIIFHPKSKGSAIELGTEKYIELAKNLESNNNRVFFTGTEQEGAFFRDHLPQSENIFDLSGKCSLDELIAFIEKADLLLAASTGPLHLAGLTGINTVGLFSTRKPIHAERWQPIGKKVVIIKSEKNSDFTQPLSIDLRDIEQELEKLL